MSGRPRPRPRRTARTRSEAEFSQVTRALAFCDRDGVVLQSRQQRPLTDAFPDVAATLAAFAGEAVVLDGEVVV